MTTWPTLLALLLLAGREVEKPRGELCCPLTDRRSGGCCGVPWLNEFTSVRVPEDKELVLYCLGGGALRFNSRLSDAGSFWRAGLGSRCRGTCLRSWLLLAC